MVGQIFAKIGSFIENREIFMLLNCTCANLANFEDLLLCSGGGLFFRGHSVVIVLFAALHWFLILQLMQGGSHISHHLLTRAQQLLRWLPFGYNRHGPKSAGGRAAVPLSMRGAGSPSNTM